MEKTKYAQLSLIWALDPVDGALRDKILNAVWNMLNAFETHKPPGLPTRAGIQAKAQGYWKCEEAGGANDFIDAANSNDLTQVNSPGSIAGQVGNARTFNAGSNQAATLSPFATDGDFTVAFITNFDRDNAQEYPVSKYRFTASNNRSFYVGKDPGTGPFRFVVSHDGTGSQGVNDTNVNPIATGTPYFVVCQHRDGVDIRISVTPMSAGSVNPWVATAYTLGVFDAAGLFEFGQYNHGSNPFDGWLDEVGFYRGNGLLTDAEIAWLFAEFKAGNSLYP